MPQRKSYVLQKMLVSLLVPHAHPPIKTVPAATTVPAGRSAGSLQVMALSPLRAAGLPLMSTVPLPSCTVALLLGGFWKGPPCGTCAGVLVAVLPCTAAGLAFDVHVAAERAVQLPRERVRQRRGHGSSRGWDHDDVRVGGDYLVALFRGWLSHVTLQLVDVYRAALEVELALRLYGDLVSLQLDVALALQRDGAVPIAPAR